MLRKAFFLYLIFCVYVKKMFCQKISFVFPEYPYKESNKNEMAFREFESACEQSPSCAILKGLERIRCVRECISPTCYQHIYYKDPPQLLPVQVVSIFQNGTAKDGVLLLVHVTHTKLSFLQKLLN